MFKKYLILFFVGIVIYAIYDFHAGNTFFFGTYMISVLLFVVGLFAWIATVVACPFSSKARSFLKYPLVFFLGFLAEIIIVDRISNIQANQSIRIGEEIVNTIGKSFAEEGFYRNALAEYVPDYMEEVPRTKIGFSGTDFKYVKFRESRGTGFELYFIARYGNIHKYDSARRGWILTD